MNSSPKRSRGLQLHVHVLAAWISLLLSGVLSAQTQVPDQGREAPAAWRPSFSPMNDSAPLTPNNGFSPQDGSASRNGFATPNGSASRNGSDTRNSFTPQSGSATRNDSASQNQGSDRFADRSQIAPVGASPDVRPGVTRVTRTFEKLPNSAGQIWREYDITPYTSELSNVERPEQAIVDWIVKETGTKLSVSYTHLTLPTICSV